MPLLLGHTIHTSLVIFMSKQKIDFVTPLFKIKWWKGWGCQPSRPHTALWLLSLALRHWRFIYIIYIHMHILCVTNKEKTKNIHRHFLWWISTRFQQKTVVYNKRNEEEEEDLFFVWLFQWKEKRQVHWKWSCFSLRISSLTMRLRYLP